MFCQYCAASILDTAVTCPSCNAPVARAVAAAPAAAAGLKAVVADALAALKRLAGDPVGRLSEVHGSLGEDRARRVGLAYGVLSLACFLLGGYLLLPFREGLFDFLGFGGVMKCLLFGIVPFGCTVLGSLGVRRAFGGQGTLGGDLVVSGAALLPISMAMPVIGLLGYENYSLMAVISVFAACTGVLVLYSGYRHVARLSERASTLAIPIVVVLVFWLGKTLATSVLESSLGGGAFGAGGFDPSDFEGFGQPRR
jgi:hypothetical protein